MCTMSRKADKLVSCTINITQTYIAWSRSN